MVCSMTLEAEDQIWIRYHKMPPHNTAPHLTVCVCAWNIHCGTGAPSNSFQACDDCGKQALLHLPKITILVDTAQHVYHFSGNTLQLFSSLQCLAMG